MGHISYAGRIWFYARALRQTPGSLLNSRACQSLVLAGGNHDLAAQWLYECDQAHEPGSGQCSFCPPEGKEAPYA